MKILDEFKLNLFSLDNKTYNFNYVLTDDFFSCFEYGMIDNGSFNVEVKLTRSERLIEVIFHIKGIIKMECDKTLKPFDFKIDTHDKIIYKFANEYEEMSEELIHIPFDYPQINLSQSIYEFISVAIPMRRIHPDLELEEEDFDEEDSLTFVYSSLDEEEDIDSEEDQHDGDDDSDDNIDPRWESLKKLK